ncbi:Levodione reductase 1 [Colletotrichum sojae]|uniref:Levodione reductase 1 n=1 Tax=Colletotrichum sojae TaxID=2175907 RepID=A0A8H6JAW1_9PEZI|nr:Levodione reductase 1 [Colletotrichum sojae]
MPSFQGNFFAVTGGASGIGLATAKAIAARGGVVCVADLDEASLEEAQFFFRRNRSKDWFKAIIAEFGRLDGASNIAGVIGRGHGIKSIAELKDDEWNKIVGVNLTGTMYCLREELRIIKDGGSIVNMASIHATTGVANHGTYAANKHGVLGTTRVAAKEMGDREIRVNAVAPGPIYTPMMQKYWDTVDRPTDAPFDEPIAFRRQGTAEEVANVVVFLLGPDSSFVSGSCYSVDGAWI